MKKIVVFLTLFFGLVSQAQTHDSSTSNKLYIKGNALFLTLGMLNVGLEYQLKEKVTLQADVFISPWKSLMGNHAQAYMGTLEGRYYFTKAFSKFYVGLNIGSAVFDIQKWNYINTYRYQRGFTVLAGATVGYQFKIKEKLNIDLYLGGGNSQGFYHGYDESEPNNVFIYYNDSRKWNRSGEWIPYRGGIMIGYKL